MAEDPAPVPPPTPIGAYLRGPAAFILTAGETGVAPPGPAGPPGPAPADPGGSRLVGAAADGGA